MASDRVLKLRERMRAQPRDMLAESLQNFRQLGERGPTLARSVILAIAVCRAEQRRRAVETLARAERVAADLAREHLGFPTLDARGLDALDFRDCNVLAIRRALRAAFYAGRASGG